MYGHTSRENRESPCPSMGMEPWGASGSQETYADDERAGAVGQARSTDEVSEQGWATSGGGDGGKG